MIIQLGQQAPGERERSRPAAALRYGATWVTGAARTADARRAVHAFLKRAARTAHTHITRRAEQDALLVVSELVTNALRHAPGPCGLVLELSADNARLGISVWDTSPALPRLYERDGARVGGHGLYLVHACSRALTATARPGGKQISAEVALGSA
ncbi:ATP-binding protein [Streptomyces naganishii]|uniref:ATP-binding protein n=1 Tax=Streptomyces naganishii JCM 4654 TaxID=1306179 RepID=A0A919CUW0_9ACTN|nr:ATP-binding protein [Streptomyces naganishii]GHD87550.1 ATP-binding protein [Streptomyces naganishii JCM 4654]